MIFASHLVPDRGVAARLASDPPVDDDDDDDDFLRKRDVQVDDDDDDVDPEDDDEDEDDDGDTMWAVQIPCDAAPVATGARLSLRAEHRPCA